FRQKVGWRRFAGEEKGARRNGQTGVLSQALIENDDPQRVEQLPLVFVNALDLAIERRVRIDAGLRLRLEPVAEPRLGGALGALNFRLERRLVRQRPKLLQFREVGDPRVADGG